MDAIKLYLKDIKKIPLLTREEELEIANRIMKGGPGSKKAREKMIRSNLRLVINIAKRYGYLGLPILDLIEEGNMGLMKAVEKYDPRKGYRFSTYAAWWIRQFITRAIANQGKTIRVPVYMVETVMRYKKAVEQLRSRAKRNPTVEEVAKKMRISIRKARALDKMMSKISSLNAPIGDSGSTEFMDMIEDESTESAMDSLKTAIQQERIEAMLDRMSEREKKILVMRFGLKDGEPHTLDATARVFNITRERVRQIEAIAIKKLRKLMEEQEKNFLDQINEEPNGD